MCSFEKRLVAPRPGRDGTVRPAAAYRSCLGLTLIELLVVIAIIGILGVLALPVLAANPRPLPPQVSAADQVSVVTQNAAITRAISDAAIPTEGYVRFIDRSYIDSVTGKALPPGKQREQIFEAAWRGDNFFVREGTGLGSGRITNVMGFWVGKSGNLHWHALGQALNEYLREDSGSVVDARDNNFVFQHIGIGWLKIKQLLSLMLDFESDKKFEFREGHLYADVGGGRTIQGQIGRSDDGAIQSVTLLAQGEPGLRITYGGWTTLVGLGLFPKLIGIREGGHTDAKSTLVRELELLEFRSTAPEESTKPFHFEAHLDVQHFKRYKFIDGNFFLVHGTNLMPVMPAYAPLESQRTAILIVLALLVIAPIFFLLRKRGIQSGRS
jgi:prepilin-type N-terminal cleavage/methylation domain-containing protein